MYVKLEDFYSTWRSILKESHSASISLTMIVSVLDVDALCAAKALDLYLKEDYIQHQIIPVVGYMSLKEAFQGLSPDISNVICIGCGSNVDLQEYLGLDPNQISLRIHVLDNHRPWDLANICSSRNVLCWDDGYFKLLDKYIDAFQTLADEGFRTDDDETDEDEDDDFPRTRQANGVTHTQAGRSGNAQFAEEERTQEDPTQMETAAPLPSRRASRERYQLARRVYDEYYRQGSHVLSSNSLQVYTLLSQIGKASLGALWLTIVGTTALEPQYPELYASTFPALKKEARRYGPQLERNRPTRTTISARRDITFTNEDDFSLFLLRQWSLYESMIHSSYLSAKLYLWTEDGRKNMHDMLSRIGIDENDAKETWAHMQQDLKDRLRDKFERVSSLYGIEHICRDGVIRQFGRDGSLSAGDCAESVAALLEAGIPNNNMEENVDDTSDQTKAWLQNFWTAWNSVDNYDKLCLGAEMAKSLQRAVVSTGRAIFEKGQLKDLNKYRLAVIKDTPELSTFTNPRSLTRLGIWISDACAEIHAAVLPLVLASLDEQNDTFLVLGMGPRKAREEILTTDTVYNEFGHRFQATAYSIAGANVRIDAFDSAVVEVAKDNLSMFLEKLALQID